MRWIALCSLMVIGFSALAQPSAQAEDSLPPLKTVECRFEVPTWARVECFDLYVPEDRSNPESPNIRLHAARFSSGNPNTVGDPIVFLDGGPGFSPLVSIPYTFDILFKPFLRNHDLIIMDQRGTGYSQPNLRCPELYYGDSIPSAISCWNRLVDEGVHMASYNSAENASDFDDLRRAMGYAQWNLYGGSYGTRLAMTIMRDHPAGLRSVVLDGVYPPEVNIYTEFPQNVDRAFQTLFTACATDAACNAAYPDLRGVFRKLIDQLQTEPASVSYGFSHSDVPFTAFDFIAALYGALYDDSAIPYLPSMIYEADLGNFEPMFQLFGERLQTDDDLTLSQGMFYAVQCTEEAAFTTTEAWESATASFEYLRPYLEGNFVFGYPAVVICDSLDLDVFNPAENEPVVSEVPTLILNGQFDPVTPPRWGKIAAQALSHSYMYTFPGLGHVVFTSDLCPQTMVLDFIDNPSQAPDASCIDFMPGISFALR